MWLGKVFEDWEDIGKKGEPLSIIAYENIHLIQGCLYAYYSHVHLIDTHLI